MTLRQSKRKRKTLLVSVIHHPIEKGDVTITEVPYYHQSLMELKERIVPGQDVLVGVNGKQCTDCSIQVKPGSEIVFIPVAAGPVILWLFEVGLTLAWQAAIVYGLSYLGGLLFGPDMPEEKMGGQSFEWNPQTTQREGIVRPECFGTNMHYGNVVTQWTDVDESGNEILYMILDGGDGPIQGTSGEIYFNDQPSSNFPDVTIQERKGTLNQTCMTGFEQNKLEYRPRRRIANAGDYAGPFTWTTPNKFFDDIEYTLGFPQGIYRYNEDGRLRMWGVGVKIEISKRDADDWTTLLETTIPGGQLNPLYKAYKVSEQGFNCEHGKQYDLRIAKTTGDVSPAKFGDILVFRSVREVVDVAFTRPGRVLLGITALGTAGLSGHLNVKWISDDKLCNVFNSITSVWEIKWTRNRAWIWLAQITQPIISGDGGVNPWVIERYDGLNPNRLDLAFVAEWASWCDGQVPDGNGGTENRMPCDIIVDYQTDVWTLAYEIAQVGRMYPYWQGTTLTGWIDKVTDEPIDIITFDNIMARSWRNTWPGFGEKAGRVGIFYKNAAEGFERKLLPMPNEAAGPHTRMVMLEGMGVTGTALATRVGNHVLARNELIKNINSVRMTKEALRYRLGRVCRVQATVPDWGKTFRIITAPSNNTLELNRIVNVSAGELIFVKSYNEADKCVSMETYTVQSTVGRFVTIAETWLVTPAKNNICAIGKAGEIKLRRIVKMRHTVNNYIDVELETYDTRLFDCDGIEPTISDSDYIWPQPAGELGKPITRWDVIDLINQMIPPQPNIEVPDLANCEWTGDDVDTVTWAKRDGDEPISFFFRGVGYDITADNTTNEFIYWDPLSPTVFLATNSASIAFGGGDHWLMCRNKDGVPFPANAVQLMHGAIIQAGTITAALAQLADLVVTTGKIANLAVETVKIGNNAVTIPTSAYTAADFMLPDHTEEYTVQEVTFTSTGQPVQLFFSHIPSCSINCGFTTRFYRGEDKIFESPTIWKTIPDIFTFPFVDTPDAGEVTYYVKLQVNTDHGSTKTTHRSLLALEVKK